MQDIIHSIAGIIAGITGVAIIAVILSRNSNTAGVIQAAGGAYGGALGVALSPITGGAGGGSPFGQSNSFGNGVQF